MNDTPPTDPYTQEPRLMPVPKPTVNGMLRESLDDVALEVAHVSGKVASLSACLIETVTSAQLLLKVVVVALLLNTLLLIALLVTVSFLYGAMR